ncbi:1f9da128-9dee-4fde-866e-bd8a24fe8da2 [Sclerotinia trifoliorum]|uniref:1f9da128-9dee-4fde-866e-bd8a24fe8da2 n=1 Tax=Sclerotinia trifoliorum TaxID=28548 RepID=A0A8H2ZT88_9HELO|nr:1f9da128-9dee-4fde-866e-bd8a24fe8da2 [Sclerotinia trifoliorum]
MVNIPLVLVNHAILQDIGIMPVRRRDSIQSPILILVGRKMIVEKVFVLLMTDHTDKSILLIINIILRLPPAPDNSNPNKSHLSISAFNSNSSKCNKCNNSKPNTIHQAVNKTLLTTQSTTKASTPTAQTISTPPAHHLTKPSQARPTPPTQTTQTPPPTAPATAQPPATPVKRPATAPTTAPHTSGCSPAATPPGIPTPTPITQATNNPRTQTATGSETLWKSHQKPHTSGRIRRILIRGDRGRKMIMRVWMRGRMFGLERMIGRAWGGLGGVCLLGVMEGRNMAVCVSLMGRGMWLWLIFWIWRLGGGRGGWRGKRE